MKHYSHRLNYSAPLLRSKAQPHDGGERSTAAPVKCEHNHIPRSAALRGTAQTLPLAYNLPALGTMCLCHRLDVQRLGAQASACRQDRMTSLHQHQVQTTVARIGVSTVAEPITDAFGQVAGFALKVRSGQACWMVSSRNFTLSYARDTSGLPSPTRNMRRLCLRLWCRCRCRCRRSQSRRRTETLRVDSAAAASRPWA